MKQNQLVIRKVIESLPVGQVARMKNQIFLVRNIYRLILLFCISFLSFCVNAQVTEHFSDETIGFTTFTSSGFTFNLTGGRFVVASYAGYGWTGTAADDYFADNYGNYPGASGVLGSITISSATFKAFELYVFPGVTGDFVSNDGSVIIRGKLLGATQFTNTIASGAINTSGAVCDGWTYVDLSSYSSFAIDQLEFELTGNLRYLAIDAFKHQSTASAPTVSSVDVPSNGTYVTGQNLNFIVNYNQTVSVNTSGGTPYIPITLNTGGVVNAVYSSGTGTTALVFRYTVASGNADPDGISEGPAITLNGATIRNSSSADAILTLNGVTSTSSVLVDAIAPFVSSVSSSNANGAYKAGDMISVTVYFSENVTVTGTPTLSLNCGGTASYASGSGTSSLKFNYTVSSGNNSSDLDYVANTSLALAGGAIKDAAGNNATLTLPAPGGAGSLSALKDILIDTALPMVSSVSVPSDATYTASQNLDFTANFNEAVFVFTTGGTPYIPLILTTGGTVHAAYVSGSGTLSLLFRYTIVTGNGDNDGITVGASITLNGGTIIDAATNSASLTLNGISGTSGVLVDAVAPTVSTVGVPANGTYSTDQNLEFTVNFTEPVTVVTSGGMPFVPVTLNTGGTVNASYESGSGTSAIVFSYIVAAGNADNNGVTVGANITTNGGTIKDAAGNNAALPLNSVGSTTSVLVDAIAPTVTSVNVPANATYTEGQHLDFTVNFSEAVNVVTNLTSPYVPVTLNTVDVDASYLSGSGTTALVFRYTVEADDSDNNGVGLGTAINANGCSLKDGAGNNVVLALNGIPSTSGILVDALAPSVTSVSVPANGTYITGQNLDFTVNFGEVVTVVTTGGTPYFPVTLNTGGTVNAAYQSGSGTTSLVFRYTVVSGNADNNGVAVGSAITINGGTIKDAAGNNATLNLRNIGITTSVLVDGIAPVVSSVGVPASATYIAGQNLDFTVNFSEAVTVITIGGMPYVPVTLTTGGTVNASYESGSGTAALVFRYVVVTGNRDIDGVTVGSAITANGGTLKDAAGNNAMLTLSNIGNTTGVLVDAIVPTVSSVSVPANGTYSTGQNLNITVNFDEPVTVNTAGGTPYIAMVLNTGGTIHAVYQSGTGTPALTFRYTVVDGNYDNDGITIGALTLSGATLKDMGGNDATLTLNSVGSTASVLIDAIAPNVTSVSSSTTNGLYKLADVIAITVTYSKAVNVTGTPTISLNSGGSALYSSGSGGTVLTFNYTVGINHSCADLDYSATNSLILSGGTIKDAVANDAVLTLPNVGGVNSLGGQKNIAVDGVVPVILSAGVPANAIYTAGQNLDFIINFSKSVTVLTTGGTPYVPVTLNTGGTVNAAYQSGTGTTALTFRYTVVAGNEDKDGISVGASITASGGTLKDGAGNDAILALSSVGNTTNVYVDAIAPTIISVGVPASATYTSGQNLDFTLNFNEAITVVSTGGTPYIPVTLNSGTVNASYLSGSGTLALVFRYTLVTGDTDNDGISVGASIAANGGTLKDASGNNAVLTLANIGNSSGIIVNTLIPGVVSVNLPANGTYVSGQNLDFTATFSQAVNVVTTGGTPYISVTLATGTVNAVYQSGTGTSSLLFRYAVASGDNDTNGIALGSSITLNGATIKNSSLVNALLILNGVGNTFGIVVDAIVPTLAITSSAGTSTSVSPIPVTITFSEPVTGFAIGDMVITNGTGANFSGSGTTYTADITPVSEGIVKINIGSVAQDAAGNTNTAAPEYSITYNPTPQIPVLASPANDVASQPIALALTWNASSGASTYTLQVSSASDFSSTIVNQNGIQTTNYSISGLSYVTKYYWRIKAVNTSGASDWSAVWSFTTIINVGVDEILSLSDYKLYPNPVKGILTIENPGELYTMMEIYAMNGSIVMTKVLHRKMEKIDLGAINAGFYYIKLSNQLGSRIVKVIKL